MYAIVVVRETWDLCFPSVLSLHLERVLCPQVLKSYSGDGADVIGAVSALAGLTALKGMCVASVNSMILSPHLGLSRKQLPRDIIFFPVSFTRTPKLKAEVPCLGDTARLTQPPSLPSKKQEKN